MAPNRVSGSAYQVLLVATLAFLVVYPTLHGPEGSPVLARVLLTALFAAGGWVVFTGHRYRAVAAALGGLAVIGAWTGYALPDLRGPVPAAVFHLAAAAFQVFVIAVLLRGVYREPAVSAGGVAAALCGYLLLGVVFGHAYCLVHLANPAAYRGLDPGVSEAEVHFQLTYYSFITLTTVGYGDVTPATDTARSLAQLEAIAGQFYIAVLVADLVGKRVAQALAAPGDRPGPDPRDPPGSPPGPG